MTASETRLRLLVSNDDGIHAQGIRTLVEALSTRYDVTVVAPDQERSATGHALTLHMPLRVVELDFGLPNVSAFAVSGTPSDCVKLGLNALMDAPPDLVVSGINHGPNLGNDVIYSGTVSAAMEGAFMGMPSVAVSLANGYERTADFRPGALFVRDYLPQVVASDLPERTILNINLPRLPETGQFHGVRLTTLGQRVYSDIYERRLDPRNQVYYWLAGEVVDVPESPDSDITALKQGYVSVTPVRLDLTHYNFLGTHRQQLEQSFPLGAN